MDHDDIHALETLTAGLGPFLRSLRGRSLTPDDRTLLTEIVAALTALRAHVAWELAPDEAAALRDLLGLPPARLETH